MTKTCRATLTGIDARGCDGFGGTTFAELCLTMDCSHDDISGTIQRSLDRWMYKSVNNACNGEGGTVVGKSGGKVSLRT